MTETNYKTTIKPWLNVVICVEPPEETTEHGVVLGGNSQYEDKKKPEKGIVVAVGNFFDKDAKAPFDLEPGDLIFYERYTRNEIPEGTTQYNFVYFRNILGVKKGVIKIK